jgi:hypothetical protein
MKKTFLAVIGILLLIFINNIPPLRLIYGGYDCEYSNNDGSFTYAEMHFKGSDFERCKRKFLDFKQGKRGDTILYRLCPINPLHFWDYGSYLFSEKYKVPYKAWDEIVAMRGVAMKQSEFQDF